jgi:hypothetical protein
MPYLASVDPDLRLGLATVRGATFGCDLAEANEALYQNPKWQPGFDELWRCDAITEFVVLPSELKEVVEMETANAARVGTGRVALVITREVVQMIGELYQHLVADRDVEIFETLDEAVSWLGLPGVPAGFDEHAEVLVPASAERVRHGW